MDDPYFCEDCGRELGHDEIRTASGVPHLDVENFGVESETVAVHQCGGRGMVIGFQPE